MCFLSKRAKASYCCLQMESSNKNKNCCQCLSLRTQSLQRVQRHEHHTNQFFEVPSLWAPHHLPLVSCKQQPLVFGATCGSVGTWEFVLVCHESSASRVDFLLKARLRPGSGLSVYSGLLNTKRKKLYTGEL